MAVRRVAGHWIPYAVVAGTLLLTLAVALYVYASAGAKDQLRFSREVERAEVTIERAFDTYATLTRSVVALYAGNTVVTREEFHNYVRRLRLGETYPGVLGLGFTRRLEPDRVAAFEAFMRSEGISDYTVTPDTPRGEYHAIQYLEPQDRRNRVALGYDMFTDPVRRDAMVRARDRGGPAISGKVVLVQEIDQSKQAGFLIYSPAYSTGGSVPASVDERRASLIGFGYAPFRAGDLFGAILGSEKFRGVQISVYAGGVSEENLLHSTAPTIVAPRFHLARTIQIVDSPWTMVAVTDATFDQTSERRWIPWVILNGVVLSLVLFLLTRSVVRNRQAVQAALEDLRDREERFRLVARATNDAIWDWDLGTNEIWWNEGVETLFGYRRVEVAPSATWWYERIHPDDREGVLSQINSVIEGVDEVWRGEYRFRRQDGTFAQVLDRGWVVRNDKGTALRMIGAMLDVSPMIAAEEKLAASERRFRTLVTTTSTIVWRVNPEGRVVDPMVSWEQFTGQSFEQYRDFGWLESVHPEDRDAALQTWRDSIPEKKPYRASYRLRHRSGEYRWVEVNGAPILDDHDEIIEWTGTSTDVHVQRQTEKELAYQSQLMRTMAESVTTCIFIMDERGYPTYMNQSAREVTGYSSIDEIRDRPLHYSVHFRKVDGSPYPIEECPIDNANRAFSNVRNAEEMFVKKDGTLFPVIYSIAPLTREGQQIGAVIELRDVTEERAAQAAVREAAERFRFLAESVPQKIFTATPAGMVDYVNAQWQEYTGSSGHETRIGKWTGTVHLDDLPDTLRSWRESIETGRPFEMEHRFRRSDGTWRWHLSRAHAMRDDDGRILLWVGTSTDIEDQKRTERTLERLYREADSANRAKDEFLATVSHELRTPMTAILGWSHLLSLGQMDDQTGREAVETIHRSAKAQAQLIDDMLDVSRIATGKLHLTFENVMVAPVVRNAIRAIAPAAEAKGVALTSELDEPGPRVRADSTRLQQIFWNLLSNSVKFTPPGGEVKVRLYPEGGEVVFEVSDTGKGITADFLPFVFDRFRQEETSSTRHYSGLGLGLSIVKQLTEMHGGRVEASSAGEDRGATFHVYLPVRALDLDATGRFNRKVARSPERSIEGLRVLLVDDDADARRVVAAILEQSGAIVTSASSAAEALERWNDRIDVLVSDIAMPKRDGYELLESLKGDNGLTIVPAIALTAYGRPEDAERILAAGFRRHLVKPVEPEELLEAIAEVARAG